MPIPQTQVAAFRQFNRFFTQRIGALNGAFLDSPFSLTEARVIYELAHGATTATALRAALGLDAGYLSRILQSFRRRGLVTQRPNARDARSRELALTARGRAAFATLDARQRADVERLLQPVPRRRRRDLLADLREVETLLASEPVPIPASEITLRAHRPGDMGWITHRQAVLYHQEYGFDERYEALIARIMADFIERFDPKHERCWVAERDGEILGSIFCVRKSDSVAKLRLLYVEPAARGSGLGSRLVRECIAFAQAKGYRRMTLWTNSILHAARRIYEREGFTLVKEEQHRSFGKSLVGQTWELAL